MKRAGRVVTLLLMALCAGTWQPLAGTPPAAAANGGAALAAGQGSPSDVALSRSARKWVQNTLSELTLEQKAAQLVMVRAYGYYQNPRSEGYRQLVATIRDLGVGGIVVFASELETVPRLLDELQAAAPVPLLIAADLERSVAFRTARGSVSVPYAMALGATRSREAARFVGEVTAREGRALGIHWALAPVADVNNNPDNPVINLRSFGEDPRLVAEMVEAFIEGAHRGGILTTAKHFPGHGDTSTDSHLVRPVVTADRERLESVELVPFRAAVAAGVDSVMPGHLAVPALDPSGAPATLSVAISDDLLRGEMGFDGLIVTDALEMAGIRPAWTGEATVRAVEAGSDVVLLPVDPRVAVQSLVRAVAEGQLTEERLDQSVRRLLAVKAELGLHRRRLVDRGRLARDVARPEDEQRALEVARAAVTVVRNQGGILPLHAEDPLRLLHLVLAESPLGTTAAALPRADLQTRRIEAETRILGPELSAETADEIVAAATRASHVLISAYIRVARSAGETDLPARHIELIRRLQETGVPVIVVSFGSPYLIAEVPEVPVFVCTYGWPDSSQRAVIPALFGEFEVAGRLPVTLPPDYPYGHGLQLPRRAMTLTAARPEDVGFRPGGMADVDRVLQRYLQQKAFPGGVLAVGYRGSLVSLEPFGRLSYGEDAAPVAADTIYDLASLTKVLATTTMALILVDEGALDLDKPVEDFLPLFRGPGKEEVTVRDLLTHSSGLTAGGDLFREIRGQSSYVERLERMELEYETGSRSVYSDYGMILLGEILERVAGQPLDVFVRERVFDPLGMVDTRFRPGKHLLGRIAPTEIDPWRGRLVHGEVHDENAFAMGGVAPHAGLFSTANDVARYAQMILNGGVFEHHRIVSRETVELFTARAGIPDSDRAIGWDTKSPEHSSAGSLFSPRSFGHLGFTGTSMWIDPDRELFVILLTNRVHPTRDNNLIREVRPAIADAVVEALAEP